MSLLNNFKAQVKGQIRDALQSAGGTGPQPKPKQRTCLKLIWSRTFPQSGTFKGYRRVRLSRYYHEEVDPLIDALSGSKLKGCTIQLDCVLFDQTRGDGCRIDVYVDNAYIGTVWQSDDEQFSMLTDYDYDKAHLLVENGSVYLFVHYPNAAPLKVSTTVK